MHPVTHLLLSWTVADAVKSQPRDRALVTWCGVAPDLDGLGILLDFGNALLGRPAEWHYHQFHHLLTHGLPAALMIPGLLCLLARQRLWVFLLGFCVFHIHLLCDLVGARGPSASDLWPIYYLAPVTRHPMLVWTHQWRLDGWQNLVVTVALLAIAFRSAIRRGYSPVSLFSAKVDQAVVHALRKRWQAMRGGKE